MASRFGIMCVLLHAMTLVSMLHIPHSDLVDDQQEESKSMMRKLRKECNCWKFHKFASEKNALNGIGRLMQINSSHPIKEGLFLIYFVKKSSVYPQTVTLGTKQVRWIYHSCIGFKDVYLDRDFLIDSSYYSMVDGSCDESKYRIIPMGNYLPLSHSVDTFIIPLRNLEYFINLFYQMDGIPTSRIYLGEYLNMKDRPYLMSIFGSSSPNSTDFKRVQSMVDMSMIFKFENFTDVYLPNDRGNQYYSDILRRCINV